MAVDRSSYFFLCGGAEKVVGHELSFVSCHWSCLQARSVHNGMEVMARRVLHFSAFITTVIGGQQEKGNGCKEKDVAYH